MKIIVYMKNGGRLWRDAPTLRHARETQDRIMKEGLLIEDGDKDEKYPPSSIYKVVIEGVRGATRKKSAVWHT